jgi:pentapeptide MXKDX repeat protein
VMHYTLMTVCVLAMPFASVAQSTDNMKQDQSQQDQMKHDDMGQDQSKKDDMDKDEMKTKKGKMKRMA